MATTQYYVGQQVKLTGEFFNEAGVLTDPTTVTVEVISGEGEKTVYSTPTRKEAGVWAQTVTLTCAGAWRYRFTGTGTLVAAGWKAFTVTEEPFGSVPNVY